MDHFELVSEYVSTGDQPQVIAKLVEGFKEGNQCETLLGVIGSGKTYRNKIGLHGVIAILKYRCEKNKCS